TVSLWHAATGQLLRTLPAKRLILRPLVFSPDGKHLFVGAGDGITRWEVATGREAGRYPADIWFMHLTDDGRTLRGALHSSSGPYSGGMGGAPGGAGRAAGATVTVHAWDAATGRRLSTTTIPLAGPGTDWAGYSRFSTDGRLIAVPGSALCETATGRELGRLTIDDQGFGLACAFSPDGSLLAAAEDHWKKGEKKKTVHVWEVATLLRVARLETGEVAPLAFPPDGRRLVTAGLDALRLWDVASQQEIASRPAHGRFRGHFGPSFASSFALGADGRTVATGHL